MKYRVSVLMLALCLLLGVPALGFSDVSDPAVAEAVTVLAGMGIVDGYADGGYHPDEALTRAQFCKLAILMQNKGDAAAASGYRSLFSDVASGHWAIGFINLAYEGGLVSGYGDGRFGPDDPVTAAQAATILLHMLGYENSVIGPFWPEDYMSKATKLGLLDGVSTGADGALTRGDAALMLAAVLECDTAGGKGYLSTWAASLTENALVLDVDAEAPDGTLHMLKAYVGGALTYYKQAKAVAVSFAGRRGTLLFDKSGKVCGFVPEDTAARVVDIGKAEADGITDGAGKKYSLSATVAVLLDDEKTTYGSVWYELDGRSSAALHYTEAGNIDLVVFSALERYAGVTLTGYYENASPNAASPSQVTLLGLTLAVADEGRASLTQFSVGDKLTVVLNAEGEVAAAHDPAEKKGELIGILDSYGNGTAKVTLTSGLTVAGTLSSSGTASDLVGGLVKVTATAVGKLSVSTLSGSAAGDKLNVAAGTLGKLTLADDVTIYDRVGKSCAVAVTLDDIALDTVPAASISHVGLDGAGAVNLLVLEDVTGNCYSYGFIVSGTKSGGSGDMAYTNSTVAVKNSGGTTTDYLTGSMPKNNAAGGIVGGADGKAAAIVYLTAAKDVARADFQGDDAVTAGGYVLPIGDSVQVYNDQTGQWTTLAAAKSFTDSFTVYYDKTPTTGGQVRLIVAQ